MFTTSNAKRSGGNEETGAGVMLDHVWYAVDATALAPRSTLLRIATGRDAADTAFLTNNGGRLWLARSEVSAVADDGLPGDDLDRLVRLG